MIFKAIKISFIAVLFLSIAFVPIIIELPKLGEVPKELPAIDTSLCDKLWPDIVQNNINVLPNLEMSDREVTQATFTDFTCNYKVTKSLSKAIYSSSKIRRALYNWAKPAYLAQFKELPETRKKLYQDMLDHAETYLKNFDYKAELKAFKEYPMYFTSKGPKGLRGKFGRMEAFIFRRVYRKELTIPIMQAWVRIIKNDLKAIE